ncbi:MAG: VWA domain-containing protein [Chloroflexia bacterium]|nr:VWA domain-containing protein [Chloroflexia bacterium]
MTQVRLNCTLGRTHVPTGLRSQLAYVLLEVAPTAALAELQMPLNFCLVLDHSGSMGDEAKLDSVKTATKLILDEMQPHDVVSVVVFDDKVQVVVPAQAATDLDGLKAQVDAIQEGGGTAISLGLSTGMGELRKNFSGQRVNQLLMLTDGQTWGDEEKCRALATQAGAQGICITALGLGQDWNRQLLDDIAGQSKGHSDYLATPQDVLAAFRQALQSARGSVVRNAVALLRLVQGVTPQAVYRVVPLISNLGLHVLSDRDIQVELGDLDKAAGQTLLVELLLPERPAGTYRVAQAEVSYDVPAQQIVAEKVRQDIMLTYTDDTGLTQQYDPRVMNLAEKVTAFKLQTRALSDIEAGDVAGATQKLRAAATRLLEMGDQELAQAMLQEAQNLEQQGQMSQAGELHISYETRKLTQKLD